MNGEASASVPKAASVMKSSVERSVLVSAGQSLGCVRGDGYTGYSYTVVVSTLVERELVETCEFDDTGYCILINHYC